MPARMQPTFSSALAAVPDGLPVTIFGVFFVLLVLVGCVGAVVAMIFRVVPKAPVTAAPLPYVARIHLLTKAERSFYEVLRRIVGDEWAVFAKVRLADLLNVPRSTKDWQAHFNRIQSKHVDFVVCDTKMVRVGLVIELDDSSHSQPGRRDRDDFLNAALAAAHLPILRVPARAKYNPNELRAQLEPLLAHAVWIHSADSGEQPNVIASAPVEAMSANGE